MTLRAHERVSGTLSTGAAAPAIEKGGVKPIVGGSIAEPRRAESEITQLRTLRHDHNAAGTFKCAIRRHRLAASAIEPPTIVFILPVSFATSPRTQRPPPVGVEAQRQDPSAAYLARSPGTPAQQKAKTPCRTIRGLGGVPNGTRYVRDTRG
jgi:hypothetical protein